MNVHIVSRDAQDENVLGRLVRALIRGTGWTASPNFSRKADINYLFPYLEHKSSMNTDRCAAWFSHYDIGRKSKTDAWDRAARAVSLRTTSAPLYYDMLRKTGESALVTPCVDLAKFAPTQRKKRAGKPLVGVSGYIYPGGRKGEELVKRLMSDAQRVNDGIELRASGRGWPCKTTHYDWDDLQSFYHSLDVFLCTAGIEGVPMPPLEAMACGVPVVIPRGVGLLDDLPSITNVHRYRVNDYDDMLAALRAALSERVDTQALRSAVSSYTSRAWVDTHLEAFDAHFSAPVYTPGPLKDWRGNAGVYVVAFGDPARQCARRLVKSIHKHMDGLPVAVVSDKPVKGADIFIEQDDLDIGGRSIKTQIYDIAPKEWDYVLYLDADTELVGDISFLFQLLADGWELAFCHNPAQYHLAGAMRRPDNQDECEYTFAQLGTDNLLQLNGGVFCFRRCEATEHFFRTWHAEWQRWGARDQAALDRALYDKPLRVYTLSSDWNCVTRYIECSESTAICHYPMEARRWRGRIKGRLDGDEAWAAVHPTMRA